MTIFIGIGAGWLAGSVLSGTEDPTPVVEAQVATQADADEVKQPATQQPLVEEQGGKDEPRSRARGRGNSRRVYVTAQAGEPIPMAVIKGKPIKKAFRQFKKVRIW
ncbi:MAG TPA: hypothetical protein VKA70_22505 [Blastocatellia bacterium]|nr:hypothetical protein [Blastocatellia bacterium]